MRRHSNTAAETTLDTTIDDNDTSIIIDDRTGWPVPGTGESALGVIGTEIFEYTGMTNGAGTHATLTGCSRGVDGTTAAAHDSGVAVKHCGSMYGLDDQWARAVLSFMPVMVSGRYYDGAPSGADSTTASTGNNGLNMCPFFSHQAITVDRIGINVTTGVAGHARLGIYTSTSAGWPNLLLVDSGELDVETNGGKEATIDQALAARTLYWLAFVTEANNVAIRKRAVSTLPNLGFESLTVDNNSRTTLTTAFTYGELPADLSAYSWTITHADAPQIRLRIV